MAYALHVWYTDDDLTNHTDIYFRTDVGGYATAQVILPGANLGYWTCDTSLSYDLFSAVKAALDLADPDSGTWTVTYAGATLPLKTKITRDAGGTSTEWEILWNHANTTFDSTWLGYSSASSSLEDVTNYVTSNWQVGRCWYWPMDNYRAKVPKLRGAAYTPRNAAGSGSDVTFGSTTWDLAYTPGLVAGPKVFQALNTSDVIASVPGMTSGDPNVAFEGLWDALALGRRKILHQQDPLGTPSSLHYMQLTSKGHEFLKDLMTAVPDISSEPRYYPLTLMCQEFVA